MNKKLFFLLTPCLVAAALFAFKPKPNIYKQDWIDFNKNGKKDIYEDPTQPVDARVKDLLSQMTMEEKTCQLATVYGYGAFLKDHLPTPGWATAYGKTALPIWMSS